MIIQPAPAILHLQDLYFLQIRQHADGTGGGTHTAPHIQAVVRGGAIPPRGIGVIPFHIGAVFQTDPAHFAVVGDPTPCTGGTLHGHQSTLGDIRQDLIGDACVRPEVQPRIGGVSAGLVIALHRCIPGGRRRIQPLEQADLGHAGAVVGIKQIGLCVACRIHDIHFPVLDIIHCHPVPLILHGHRHVVSILDVFFKLRHFCSLRGGLEAGVCTEVEFRHKSGYYSPVNIAGAVETAVFAQIVAQLTRVKGFLRCRAGMYHQLRKGCDGAANSGHGCATGTQLNASPTGVCLQPAFIFASCCLHRDAQTAYACDHDHSRQHRCCHSLSEYVHHNPHFRFSYANSMLSPFFRFLLFFLASLCTCVIRSRARVYSTYSPGTAAPSMGLCA